MSLENTLCCRDWPGAQDFQGRRFWQSSGICRDTGGLSRRSARQSDASKGGGRGRGGREGHGDCHYDREPYKHVVFRDQYLPQNVQGPKRDHSKDLDLAKLDRRPAQDMVYQGSAYKMPEGNSVHVSDIPIMSQTRGR